MKIGTWTENWPTKSLPFVLLSIHISSANDMHQAAIVSCWVIIGSAESKICIFLTVRMVRVNLNRMRFGMPICLMWIRRENLFAFFIRFILHFSFITYPAQICLFGRRNNSTHHKLYCFWLTSASIRNTIGSVLFEDPKLDLFPVLLLKGKEWVVFVVSKGERERRGRKKLLPKLFFLFYTYQLWTC